MIPELLQRLFLYDAKPRTVSTPNRETKKEVRQQEKDQFHRVQVGVMQRRGQMLRKETAVETVNEWLLETRGRRCVEMLTCV